MDLALIVLLIPLTLMVLYLDVLTVAAAFVRRRPPSVSPRYHFALLVPAHNEEQQLPRLLRSISSLNYPRTLYDVHVVADNCQDRTASVAGAAGAIVHERHDEHLRGKGYALQWLLARIGEQSCHYDGYVIVDADSVVSTNLLATMNNHLARGDQAVQCQDGVLNPEESWVSALSYVALALFNNLRPLGRDALGLSVGLRGNGMCFASAIIERFGWEVFGLAEDHAYHAQLVGAGIRVRYAADARVLAEQPTTLDQAHSQSVRWERGRLQMVRDTAPRLLSEGIRHLDPAPLDTLAEQLVPPFTVLTAAIMFAFFLTVLLHATAATLLASLLVLGELWYVLVGLHLVGAGPRTYLALLSAPLYLGWKLWTIAIAVTHPNENVWVRTARSEKQQ